MINIKKILNKINNLENIKKITKTMEMVSISKLNKINKVLIFNKNYNKRIYNIIKNINLIKNKSFFYKKKKKEFIGILIISTDNGLCGNLNNNLFKKILLKINKYKKIKIFILGLKGFLFFKNLNYKIKYYNFKLNKENLIKKIKYLIKDIIKNFKIKLSKLLIASNKYINIIKQIPKIKKLLPFKKRNNNNNWDYIYEQNIIKIFNKISIKYIESNIYKKIIENINCEQASRMLSMKLANENSQNLIKEFKLIYNKTRQSKITQEINEIISGASII